MDVHDVDDNVEVGFGNDDADVTIKIVVVLNMLKEMMTWNCWWWFSKGLGVNFDDVDDGHVSVDVIAKCL